MVPRQLSFLFALAGACSLSALVLFCSATGAVAPLALRSATGAWKHLCAPSLVRRPVREHLSDLLLSWSFCKAVLSSRDLLAFSAGIRGLCPLHFHVRFVLVAVVRTPPRRGL